MAVNKTRPSDAAVQDFLGSVEHPVRREDGFRLLELMKEGTGQPAVMWGASMVGFGSYHYKYATGTEGDSLAVGFSPRKGNLALYGLTFSPEAEQLLPKLGKYKTGAACLYINKLDDVDQKILLELIRTGYEHVTTTMDQA